METAEVEFARRYSDKISLLRKWGVDWKGTEPFTVGQARKLVQAYMDDALHEDPRSREFFKYIMVKRMRDTEMSGRVITELLSPLLDWEYDKPFYSGCGYRGYDIILTALRQQNCPVHLIVKACGHANWHYAKLAALSDNCPEEVQTMVWLKWGDTRA